MENNTMNVILEQKLDNCRYTGLDDFTAPQELTVTITLNEYRDLIRRTAMSDAKINEANVKRYEIESENEKLKKEIDSLKEKIYKLQNPDINNKEESV